MSKHRWICNICEEERDGTASMINHLRYKHNIKGIKQTEKLEIVKRGVVLAYMHDQVLNLF